MALIGGGEALTLEHMAEVPTTARAHDLDARHPESAVGVRHDGARDNLVKSGPTTPRIELGRRRVERLSAAGACKVAILRVELVVLTGARVLCPFVAQDVVLLGREHLTPFLLRALHLKEREFNVREGERERGREGERERANEPSAATGQAAHAKAASWVL